MPDLNVLFLDFATAIRQKMEKEKDLHLAFWRRYLQNTKPLTLPIRKEARGDQHDGRSLLISMERDDVEKLRHRCLIEGVSVFSALFSAVMSVFRRVSGEGDFTVGSIMSIREDQAYRDVVGMFVNTVLLRSVAPNEITSVRESVLQSHKSMLDVMSFRHTPLTVLIEELRLPRDRDEFKVFDIMVNYHPFGTLFEPNDYEPFQGKVQFVDNETTTVGLGIDIYDWGAIFEIRIAYCGNIYDLADISSLGGQIRIAIEKMSQVDWSCCFETLTKNVSVEQSIFFKEMGVGH
jgi:hypothetical protein